MESKAQVIEFIPIILIASQILRLPRELHARPCRVVNKGFSVISGRAGSVVGIDELGHFQGNSPIQQQSATS